MLIKPTLSRQLSVERLLRTAQRFAFPCVLAVCSLGCGPHFSMFAAKDFVVLSDSYPYDFRATTPEGVVIGVREFDNKKEHGELDFWAKAIEKQLRDGQGYALLEKKPFQTKQGQTGSLMRFGLDREKTAHIYVVCVFATSQRVYLVEAGGEESQVKRHQAQIDWSLSEFVIR